MNKECGSYFVYIIFIVCIDKACLIAVAKIALLKFLCNSTVLVCLTILLLDAVDQLMDICARKFRPFMFSIFLIFGVGSSNQDGFSLFYRQQIVTEFASKLGANCLVLVAQKFLYNFSGGAKLSTAGKILQCCGKCPRLFIACDKNSLDQYISSSVYRDNLS